MVQRPRNALGQALPTICTPEMEALIRKVRTGPAILMSMDELSQRLGISIKTLRRMMRVELNIPIRNKFRASPLDTRMVLCTPEMEALIREMRSGPTPKMSVQDLADRLGILDKTLSRMMRELGVEATRKKAPSIWNDYKVERLRQYWPYMSVAEIAEKLQVSPNTIRGKARRLGLTKGHTKTSPRPNHATLPAMMAGD